MASLEFNDREDGNKGLQSMWLVSISMYDYGASPSLSGTSQDIQITDAYSTDAELCVMICRS